MTPWTGSFVHGISQARILEWVTISFSRGPSQGSNPGLLHCRQILYRLSHQGDNDLALTCYNVPWAPLLPIFLSGLFVFLILSCMSCFCILEINLLSVLFENIFFHSEGCLFILLIFLVSSGPTYFCSCLFFLLSDPMSNFILFKV